MIPQQPNETNQPPGNITCQQPSERTFGRSRRHRCHGEVHRRHEGSTFRKTGNSTFDFARDELFRQREGGYIKSTSNNLFDSVLAKYFVYGS